MIAKHFSVCSTIWISHSKSMEWRWGTRARVCVCGWANFGGFWWTKLPFSKSSFRNRYCKPCKYQSNIYRESNLQGKQFSCLKHLVSGLFDGHVWCPAQIPFTHEFKSLVQTLLLQNLTYDGWYQKRDHGKQMLKVSEVGPLPRWLAMSPTTGDGWDTDGLI